MSDLLSFEQVAEMFFWHVRKNYRCLKDAAEHYGCSVGFVSAVQTGAKRPNRQMREELGIRKVSGYAKER